MIPTLLLLAGVVAAAAYRQTRLRKLEIEVNGYVPNETELRVAAGEQPGDSYTADFDLIGTVTVSNEAEFMAVGDKFAGQGPNMTQNDSQQLLEMMFWGSAKGWG